ncbi:MAG: hypothetical protein ACI841_000041 [Planctomycetota bacterium]|jgi:uncharacterized protein YdiU (UPF0061 family)
MSLPPIAGSLNTLRFDNRFTRDLPGDARADNVPRQVHGACFSRVRPLQVREPLLLAHASEVAGGILGLSQEEVLSPAFTAVFSGNEVLEGMDPFAMCYGGHQFGHWAGQLGDGRAINLGAVATDSGEHWTLQLKGAGPTPYSRTADGFAVLRSSVREFLCSEAMHHLGVPTTRALSLVTTGEEVLRDMFYDGNAQNEPGAVVCRVARSFTRFGNFQLPAARGETELLRKLVDHTIRCDFPHLDAPTEGALSPALYLRWFEDVCRRTSTMILHWMRVGFVHGVMNTDNMSILGETIDYGPYGWLEDHDPQWTPNTTDAGQRRYCYGNQASIAHWNLVQLATAIAGLMDGDTDPLVHVLKVYPDTYAANWRAMMLTKLGLESTKAAADQALLDELLEVLSLLETDMTLFYRCLAKIQVEAVLSSEASDTEVCAGLTDAYYQPAELQGEAAARSAKWIRSYAARIQTQGTPDELREKRMNEVNPIYVLRNYQAQLAIDASVKGDHSQIAALLDVLRRPYDEREGLEDYAAKRPEWARHKPGCSMLSCSS